jgi:hypothetical protein
MLGLSSTEQLLYVTVTHAVSVIGSAMLWLTCVIFAIIARRYELVLHKRTRWQIMMLAPSGLLVYTIMRAVACIFSGQVKLSIGQAWISYLFFFASGLLCLMVAVAFYRAVTPSRGGGR